MYAHMYVVCVELQSLIQNYTFLHHIGRGGVATTISKSEKNQEPFEVILGCDLFDIGNSGMTMKVFSSVRKSLKKWKSEFLMIR
jgi:hypothetical protein